MVKKHARWGWLFVSPYVFALLFLTLIPLLFAIYLSFCRYDMFDPPVWKGLSNYKYILFENEDVWPAFRNIWVFAILQEALKLSLASVLAVFLNSKLKSISAFRIIYFIPNLTPAVVAGMVWKMLYREDGILNEIFSYIGLGPFKFHYSSNWFEVILSVVIMCIWTGVGYSSMFLLAGLQGLSTEVLEAADVDGATGIQKFFRVIFPLMSPTLFFLIITGFAGSLQVFEVFFVLSAEGNYVANVPSQWIYTWVWGAEGKIGWAAALGFVLFFMVLIFTIIQKIAEKKWVYYEQ